MHERLVEGWLDSANERSYQAPFCQMLVADGHRIIHTTRHAPIEFGKDIITVNPDGVTCVFQLKGNPGGRLTLTQFNEIYAQLSQLATFQVDEPGVPSGPHRSYLVTNGLVEEEVRLAIREFNKSLRRKRLGVAKLGVLQRGDLLDMAKRLGHSLWPTEVAHTHNLLKCLVDDGKGFFPLATAHNLLAGLLCLEEGSQQRIKSEALRRRITSGALLTSIALKPFSLAENHYAVMSAWVFFAAYAVAACERHKVSFEKNAKAAVIIAREASLGALVRLAQEVVSRKSFLEGDVFVDSAVFCARITLLKGLLSVLWFWCEDLGWPDSLERADVEKFLDDDQLHLDLWGEAAYPQLLAFYWYKRATQAGGSVELMLTELVRHTVAKGLNGRVVGLPAPYWNLDDVLRHRLSCVVGSGNDPMRNESQGVRSFYAEGLLHLLVRTKRKEACRELWPDLTRISWTSFIPSERWGYCLLHAQEGSNIEVEPQLTETWASLEDAARSTACDHAPKALISNRYMHLLHLILLPHRGTPATLRCLGRKFDETWFIGPETQ